MCGRAAALLAMDGSGGAAALLEVPTAGFEAEAGPGRSSSQTLQLTALSSLVNVQDAHAQLLGRAIGRGAAAAAAAGRAAGAAANDDCWTVRLPPSEATGPAAGRAADRALSQALQTAAGVSLRNVQTRQIQPDGTGADFSCGRGASQASHRFEFNALSNVHALHAHFKELTAVEGELAIVRVVSQFESFACSGCLQLECKNPLFTRRAKYKTWGKNTLMKAAGRAHRDVSAGR